MRHPSLDLATINAAQKAATDVLKSYVCELEQQALDAGLRREYRAAQLNSDWAFAADLCVHKVASALSQLFLEACSPPPLKSHTTVQLPSLARPAEEEVELAEVHVLCPEQPELPVS